MKTVWNRCVDEQCWLEVSVLLYITTKWAGLCEIAGSISIPATLSASKWAWQSILTSFFFLPWVISFNIWKLSIVMWVISSRMITPPSTGLLWIIWWEQKWCESYNLVKKVLHVQSACDQIIRLQEKCILDRWDQCRDNAHITHDHFGWWFELVLHTGHLAVRVNNKVLCMLKYSKFFHKDVRDR